MLTDVLKLSAVKWIGIASFTWGRREEGRDGARKDRIEKRLVSPAAAVPAPKDTTAVSLCSYKIKLGAFASGNILGLHFDRGKTMR